jgi:ribonucleoside-diphosphate reductase alpha chain
MATSFGAGNGGSVGTDKNMRSAKGAGGAGASKAKPKPQARAPQAQENGAKARGTRGVTVTRKYTRPGVNPLESGATSADPAFAQELVYERRSSVITNPDGSIVFKLEGAEIPSTWSQLATDIVISKYFRKAGLFGDAKQGERSVGQVVHRISNTIRQAADRFGGYFATKADADAFEAELSFYGQIFGFEPADAIEPVKVEFLESAQGSVATG